MDPTLQNMGQIRQSEIGQLNPQSLAILQALQGRGGIPDGGMANSQQQQNALGGMGQIPQSQINMYNAMSQAPPMTPPPAPIY